MNKRDKLIECWPDLRDTDRNKFAGICENWLGKARFDGKKAAKMMGYTEKSAAKVASRVLKLDGSKDYMVWWGNRVGEKAGVNPEDVVKELKLLLKYCTETPSGKRRKTINVPETKGVLELMGRSIGMWITKIEHHITAEQVQSYMLTVINIVKQEVHDPNILNVISMRFNKELGLFEEGGE